MRNKAVRAGLAALVGVITLLVGCSSNAYIYDSKPVTPVSPTFALNTSESSPSTPDDTVEVVVTGTVPASTNPLLDVKTKEDLARLGVDIIYPVVIVANGFPMGFTLDFWPVNDNTPVLGHKMGAKMGIKVYNSHDKDCTFILRYDDIGDENFYDKNMATFTPNSKVVVGEGTRWDSFFAGGRMETRTGVYQIATVDSPTQLTLKTPYIGVGGKDSYRIAYFGAYNSYTDRYYAKAPAAAKDWLTIKESMVILRPQELRDVPISFTIPAKAVVPDAWEFRITVINYTYMNMINIFPQVRYLITMNR